jgi:hypothetical protein
MAASLASSYHQEYDDHHKLPTEQHFFVLSNPMADSGEFKAAIQQEGLLTPLIDERYQGAKTLQPHFDGS